MQSFQSERHVRMPSHSSMSEDGNWRQGRSWQAAMWFERPGFMLLDESYRMGTHFQDLWPRGARIARCHGHDACGTSHKKTEVPSAPHSRGPCYWASSSSGAKRYLTCSREHGRSCTFSKGFNAIPAFTFGSYSLQNGSSGSARPSQVKN